MVTPKNTNVYLEAVEVTENKGAEIDKIRNGTLEGIQKRKHSQRILGYRRQWYTTSHNYKRKTCTLGIL